MSIPKYNPLNVENYTYKILRFQDRQAGIGVVYDPSKEKFFYNAYCLEIKIMKELYAVEFEFLEDAVTHINEEFGTWKIEEFGQKKSCGDCHAK